MAGPSVGAWLTIGGSTYSADGAPGTVTRMSKRLLINSCTNNYDGNPGTLQFTEYSGEFCTPPSFACGAAVAVQDRDSPYTNGLFWSGEVIDRQGDFLTGVGYVWHYAARSLEYRAGLVNVTNPVNLTGTIRYNLRPTDDGYDPVFAKLEVGDILKRLFDGHASQLAAYGITGYVTVGGVATELAPLTIVPNQAIVLKGANLWVRCLDLLRDWHGKYWMWIDPTGTIRVADSLAGLPAHTLTYGPASLGGKRMLPPQLKRSTESCNTRTVVRGQDIREGAFLTKSGGTLADNYTSGQTAAWKYTDFSQPGGSFDVGNVVSQTASSLVYQSDYTASAWGIDFLSNNNANASLINPVATGIEGFENRPVLSNTALTAGGTCTINLQWELANTGYARCALAMVPTSQSKVYREWLVLNTYVAAHMENYFHFENQWISKNQIIKTIQATAASVWNSATWPMPIEVDPVNGVIRAYEPFVKPWNPMPDLIAGGSSVHNVPQDVWAFVPFTVGVLTAAYPPDIAGVPQYGGTAHAVDGLTRSVYVDVPTWVYPGDRTNMEAFAQSIAETRQDAVVEGTVEVREPWPDAMGGPFALNIGSAWPGSTTGLEAANLPVRSVTVTWAPTGAVRRSVTAYVSNRRRRNTGDAYYIRDGFLQIPHGGFGSVAGSIEGSNAAQAAQPGQTSYHE